VTTIYIGGKAKQSALDAFKHEQRTERVPVAVETQEAYFRRMAKVKNPRDPEVAPMLKTGWGLCQRDGCERWMGYTEGYARSGGFPKFFCSMRCVVLETGSVEELVR